MRLSSLAGGSNVRLAPALGDRIMCCGTNWLSANFETKYNNVDYLEQLYEYQLISRW